MTRRKKEMTGEDVLRFFLTGWIGIPLGLGLAVWLWNNVHPFWWAVGIATIIGFSVVWSAAVSWAGHERAATRRYRFEPAVRRRPPRLEWEEMLRLANHRCFYCGEVRLSRELNAEHVVPVIRGGVSLPVNIVVSCQSCNLRKATMTGREFIKRPSAEQEARFRAIDEVMAARRVPGPSEDACTARILNAGVRPPIAACPNGDRA